VSAAREPLQGGAEAAIRDRRAAVLDELGAEAVLWLAAPPVWTLGAAEAAGFPVPSVVGFVRRARDVGWCKVRGSLVDYVAPDLLFWMPDEVRREVMDVLRDRRRTDRLARDHMRVVESVAFIRSQPPQREPTGELSADEFPGALAAWAELMAGLPQSPSSPPRAAAASLPASPAGLTASADVSLQLVMRTRQAIADGNLSLAQDLVAAGEAIAGVLAGTTEQALSRARRLLELGLRRRQDDRALVRYLHRPELSDAVARLLTRGELAGTQPEAGSAPAAGPGAGEAPWALHLRGVGGVGKTTLIRYLASGRYAAERGLPPIPVARADFDHISPDFPVRRPVQLLLELADELALHTASSDLADRALSAFSARAARAHEAVSGLREAGGSPLRNEEVALAVDGFGDVLAALGDVLLILDTCEELAKADMGNPAAPAVRATLDIIKRLHERAPSVRVLFAGRRPLPEHPYLTVQPVAGFTVDEARRYLAASTSRKLPADLADEMLRQSAAVDGPVPDGEQLPDRVSPFDLALYAAWADDDPDLDVAQVERGSDAYVEGRIIDRLDDRMVIRALPALASAGRCRVATIAELLGCDPAMLGPRLAEQEWIDADDPPAHVMAAPALARRLCRYFEAGEGRAEFAARNAALASALSSRVRAGSLAEIDVDELLAALRLAVPADAAALWDSIVARATEPPGRWGTVLNMTLRLLGEWDEEEWPTTSALRSTVVAAHIAASRRDSALFNAEGSWETVLTWSSAHPDPGRGRELQTRAAFGLLPYRPDDESLWTIIDRWGSFGPYPVDEPEAAAVVDTAHRLLEASQVSAAGRLGDVLMRMRERSSWTYSGLAAWRHVVLARLLGDSERARTAGTLAAAEELAARVTGPEPSWPDWIPPGDLLARVRIERGLIAPPDDLGVLDEWESYAASHLDTIDGERLASLCLRIRLRHGVVNAAVAERWEAADRYVPDRTPACTAHDLVPPLFVSAAQAWLSAGQPEPALDLLDRRRAAALGTRQDDTTVRHADAATTDIVRRLRSTDQRALLSRLATEYSDPVRRALRHRAWQALAILGDTPPVPPAPSHLETPGDWHAWWQCEHAGASMSPPYAPPPDLNWPPARTSADVADIRADLTERRLLPAAGVSAERLAAWESALGGWLSQPLPPNPPLRSAEPHRELRAAMRTAALAGEAFAPPAQIPRRLLAEMAFEEAELTALRLPGPAVRLFTLAADGYTAAGDALGTLLARLSVLRIVLDADGRGLPGEAEARQAMEAALSALSDRDPGLATALASQRPPPDVWRYWAGTARRRSEPTRVDPPPAPRIRLRQCILLGIMILTLCEAAGWASLAVYLISGLNSALELWSLPVNALIIAAIALFTERTAKFSGLADGRGVGAGRLSRLVFDVYPPQLPDLHDLHAFVDVRPWRTAPLPVRAVVCLLIPVAGATRLLRNSTEGYAGNLRLTGKQRDLLRVSWEGPPPEAGLPWWLDGGTALGTIWLPLDAERASVPWERVMSASLSPHAAGRIEWIRLVQTSSFLSGLSSQARLDAPPAWTRAIGSSYAPARDTGEGLGLRHVIGRTVATSAGPVMDMSGDTGTAGNAGDERLLGITELKLGRPGTVILQAEPVVGDPADTRLSDDHAEKLQLGAALAEDGVPAVFLLPPLPSDITDELSRIITAHAGQRQSGDAQGLLARLRKAIAPHVPPQVLDDVVLFLNVAKYRS